MDGLYLIDETNDFPPEPGQIKRSNVEPIQHDYTAGRVIEALQQRRHCGFSCRVQSGLVNSFSASLYVTKSILESLPTNYLLRILQQWQWFYKMAALRWTSLKRPGQVW